MQIISAPIDEGTLRQRAFNQGLQQIAAGMRGYGQAKEAEEARTLRQQALEQRQQALNEQQRRQDLETAIGLSKTSGQEVTPEMVGTYMRGEQMAPGIQGPPQPPGMGLESVIGGIVNKQQAMQMEKASQMRAEKERKLLSDELKRAQIESLRKQRQAGKQISPGEIRRVEEGNVLPQMLQDVQGTIEANKDIFGPVMGTIASLNPYDTKAQSVDAQMRASSQAFGRFMEGGVLRKEDEEKYRKMFPQLGDTPEVAKNKLAIVQNLLETKQGSLMQTLEKSGYDVSGLKRQFSGAPLPPMLGRGAVPVSVQPQRQPIIQAQPEFQPAAHPQANEAIQWAQQNRNDPRAQAILQRLGAR